jgi:serine/threonine protein kinase
VTAIERDSGRWLGKYDRIAALSQQGEEDAYLAASVAPGGYTKLALIRVFRGPEEQTVRFLEAARAATHLKHANIAETYTVVALQPGGKAEETGPYVVTEYVEGQTLAKVVERIGAGELPRRMWLRVLVEVLSGLHHAHEARGDAGAALNLVHGHLAPSRVAVTYDGQVKVLDFGRLLERSVQHLAPEQARGEPFDRRADIFAIGTMLWAASTRQPLWGDRDAAQILGELTSGRIPSLRQVDPSVPAPLADIVGRALAPNADDRYSTAMHLQADLEGFLRASGEEASPRDIGRVVAHAFLEERLRTTTIVDEQLRRVRARAISGGDGALEPVSLLRIEVDSPASSRRPDLGVPTSVRPFLPQSRAPRAVPPEPARRDSRRRLLWFAGIAGAVAVAVIVVAAILADAR